MWILILDMDFWIMDVDIDIGYGFLDNVYGY